MDDFVKRLADLDITLPPPSTPVANYVPWMISGKTIYVSGQIPLVNGKSKFDGVLPENLSIEEKTQEARQCAINIITHLRDACNGNLSRIKRIIKLTGFVASTPDFKDHPKIINGASDLMVAIFGEKGRHARVAVGVASLPLGVSVEIDAIAELE
jgi:enamine deaminase RidA (YjgF/YER057c/UK114 family)